MKKALALAMFAMAANQAAGQGLTYPTPPTDNTVDEYFGVKVADPYRPLEDDHSEATMQWVEAENQVTQDYLAKIPFRGKLLKRLREVSDYGKVGAPFYVKATGKWYFYKNNGLQNQSVLYEMDGLGRRRTLASSSTPTSSLLTARWPWATSVSPTTANTWPTPSRVRAATGRSFM